jgi:hypothetical protein
VRAELSAWGRLDVDEIMSHASADAVWDNVAIRAFRGYDEIREAVQLSGRAEIVTDCHERRKRVSRTRGRLNQPCPGAQRDVLHQHAGPLRRRGRARPHRCRTRFHRAYRLRPRKTPTRQATPLEHPYHAIIKFHHFEFLISPLPKPYHPNPKRHFAFQGLSTSHQRLAFTLGTFAHGARMFVAQDIGGTLRL